MKVSLNLKPCDIPESVATLSELVRFMERESVPSGQVITRIVLDGEELDEDAEQADSRKPVGEIGVVEFYSARTIDLARDGLTDANELLPSLTEDLPMVASELRGGNVSDGLAMFSKCVEVVSWFVSLVTALDIMLRGADQALRSNPIPESGSGDYDTTGDFSTFSGDDGPELRTFASVENLRQKLIDIEEAQRNNDTLLLADLIEYELLPIVQIWTGEVPQLLSKLNRESGTA